MQTTMTALKPGVWRSAPDVSKLRFALPYLGVTRLTGIFRDHRGKLTVDDSGRITSFELEFATKTIDMGDDYRNELATSMDFLDVESYPWINFQSREVLLHDNELDVTGVVRINGIAHELRVHGRITGLTETSLGDHCLGVEATGALSRSAFGLREPQDPATLAQPDADLVRFHAELVFMHRTT